jgi:putative peptidoglycan lipid II flippase
VNQIYYILNRVFASGLVEGSISSLNYAAKLAQFPAGVFVLAITVAVYPSLTEYALKGDLQKFQGALEKGLGVVMLLTAPAAVGLAVLRFPIVRLLFEGGAFTASDTMNTASALLYYAGGIVAFSLILVLLRVFFAFRDVKTPVLAGFLGIAVNVIISFLAIENLGHNGLALATSMGSIVNMLVFFLFLKKHLPQITFGPLLISLAKISVASLLMGVAVYTVSLLFAGCGDFLQVLSGIIAGVIVYIALVFLLRMREGVWAKEMIRKRLKIKRIS